MLNLHGLLCSIFIFISVITSCDQNVEKEQSAVSTINENDLGKHIKALASDEFQGRKPFTIGEEKTIEYIRNEFMNMGLKPGNNGSYYQEVPMVEITGKPDETMVIKGKGGAVPLELGKDFVALTRHVQEQVNIKNSELVFAGYGIVAPEYEWNDYEGLNVEGKTVIVLVNDPGFANNGDNSLFRGKEMTYYGRWSYKYEEAARQGATGVLIVHDTEPASYPWQVVENGWTGAKLYLQDKDKNMGRSAMEGWITKESANKIFEAAGLSTNLDSIARNEFKAIPLGLNVSFNISNTFKNSKSYNVIALYPGTELADEYIIYTAHWDHLGIAPAINGDSIYNGAIDNASGIAAVLEIAEAFTKTRKRPLRSTVFLAVTAEEQGLLGSAHYAENPIFPLSRTVANINMDALMPFGKMKDLKVIGLGQSELDEYAEEAAAEQGRYITADPNPGAGSFYRSDHFNFAKVGVPALYAKGGYDHVERGIEYGEKMDKEYTAIQYHQPSDQYDPENWDLSGMVQDVQLFFNIGRKLAYETSFPEWKDGSEFKAIREKDLVGPL